MVNGVPQENPFGARTDGHTDATPDESELPHLAHKVKDDKVGLVIRHWALGLSCSGEYIERVSPVWGK
jgi:hypothetical protein